ncbi:MAG: WhiB family transcriptional regulator [Nocardioides sp.]|nr:WhiB family transcriptional regulator [Nocardioides sp.]MBC7279155.1 WhiB family transcriptional regulator [Nocardioides sp.]
MTSPDAVRLPGDLRGALCPQTDPEIFFPEAGASPAAAKKVCAACDVTSECLALALSLGTVKGVWGGTTERERQALKRAAGDELRRTCRGCGAEFTRAATSSRSAYCGDLCRHKARRTTQNASQTRRTSPRRAA